MRKREAGRSRRENAKLQQWKWKWTRLQQQLEERLETGETVLHGSGSAGA